MADEKREKLPTHQSPPGSAIFPYLNTPDTKWKTEGEFKTKLSFPTAEAKAIKKIVDDQMKIAEEKAKKFAKEQTAKTKKKVEAKAADLPIFEEVDEDGNETGNTVASFKSTASGVSKKTGKPWKRTIPLFDAVGNAMRKLVYGGSKLIVAYSASPWVNPKAEYGVKLQIEAVQVLELVSEGGAQRSSSSFGFAKQDGYVAGEDQDDDAGSDDAGDDEAPADDDKF